MNDTSKERLTELCKCAAGEQNNYKLIEIVEEISRLLEARDTRMKQNVLDF